jgi:hypothetical protein
MALIPLANAGVINWSSAGLSYFPVLTVRAASAAQARNAITAGSASNGDSGLVAVGLGAGALDDTDGLVTADVDGLTGAADGLLDDVHPAATTTRSAAEARVTFFTS